MAAPPNPNVAIEAPMYFAAYANCIFIKKFISIYTFLLLIIIYIIIVKITPFKGVSSPLGGV